MILKKLSQIESESNSTPERSEAINTIKLLLIEIDYMTEIIPLDDLSQFQNLLVFIKGCSLTPEEEKLTNKLILN